MTMRFSAVASAKPHPVGSGCTIAQFRHDAFASGEMSPFVMVDHFHMWKPTFDVHPHAGFSAVTLLFEDTQGTMASRDSIGHDAVFGAGDLHWTLAGRGILHTQIPVEPQAHIHALQVFVNLPASLKDVPPDSFHVRREHMPTIEANGARMRVVAGDFGGCSSVVPAPCPILMLDVHFNVDGARVEVPLPSGWNVWTLVIEGSVAVGDQHTLLAEQAICASDAQGGTLALCGPTGAHCVVLAAQRIDEPVIAQGPFVFESAASLERAVRDFRAGRFGSI